MQFGFPLYIVNLSAVMQQVKPIHAVIYPSSAISRLSIQSDNAS